MSLMYVLAKSLILQSRIRECMGALKQCGRGAELDERVVALFDSVIAAAAGPVADKSEAVFLATAFCAAVYGADRTVVVNITLTNYLHSLSYIRDAL